MYEVATFARGEPMDDEYIQLVAQHISQNVGSPHHVFHELIPQDVHIDIHVVKPTSERNYYTLVTSGMGEHSMAVPSKEIPSHIELMMCLPPNWRLRDNDL